MKYILIFILLFNLLYSKTSNYSIIIKKPFNESLLDITQDYDKQISAIGYSNSYDVTGSNIQTSYSDPFEYLSSLKNKHGSHFHLIKTDKKANITLNKSINSVNFAKAVSIIKTPNNGYFIGGYSVDGSLSILKLNSVGDTLFTKTFGTKNKDKMNSLVSLKDGGVLSVGYSRTSRSPYDDKFESGLGLNDIYLSRFTKNGIKLWSKKYGTEFDDEGVDAVEADDGSIIVISITKNLKQQNVDFMKLNENGDKIWLKHYKSDEQVVPHKIIKLRDGNFIISLSKKDNLRNNQIKLIKIDNQKNILIDKEIYTTYSSVLKDIKEYSNGNIIGVGYVKDAYNSDALVMLLNSDLKLLNQNHFGDDNYDQFNAVTILNNSQVAAAGIHTDENLQESNMWIVKLNKDLTITKLYKTKSEQNQELYLKLSKIFKNEIENQLLSIKNDLTIEFTSTNLYFKVSKYNLTKQQKAFLTKFSKKLIPFLKEKQNNIKTIEINGHTSSEWGDLNFTNNYLKNQKLSMNRSYSTLEFIFKNQNQEIKILLSKIFKGSGVSYSKKIVVDNAEDKEKSRRVSFKIILNDTK